MGGYYEIRVTGRSARSTGCSACWTTARRRSWRRAASRSHRSLLSRGWRSPSARRSPTRSTRSTSAGSVIVTGPRCPDPSPRADRGYAVGGAFGQLRVDGGVDEEVDVLGQAVEQAPALGEARAALEDRAMREGSRRPREGSGCCVATAGRPRAAGLIAERAEQGTDPRRFGRRGFGHRRKSAGSRFAAAHPSPARLRPSAAGRRGGAPTHSARAERRPLRAAGTPGPERPRAARRQRRRPAVRAGAGAHRARRWPAG